MVGVLKLKLPTDDPIYFTVKITLKEFRGIILLVSRATKAAPTEEQEEGHSYKGTCPKCHLRVGSSQVKNGTCISEPTYQGIAKKLDAVGPVDNRPSTN